jgi:predicted permease
MEIPLLKGRYFSEHDNPDAPLAAIVEEKFAQRFWPRGDAIGKHLWFNPKKPYTIVGVVGTVKQYGLDTDGKIATYFPQGQDPSNDMFLVVRTSSDPAALSGAVVREIHAVDPAVAVYGIRTMQDRLYESLARQRFASTLLSAFAAFALLLAAVGIYGVMSYLVTQSTHDIGLRVALGAQPGNIVGLVVRQGMELAAIGILAGLAGAAALTRLMASLLFGVSATDAVTFGAVAVLLAAVAFAATVIPARRATRVDPMVALREE